MCFDDRYLWPWAMTIATAKKHADRDFRCFVANANGLLTQEGKSEARRIATALDVNLEIQDFEVPVGEYSRNQWNATVYARLRMMDELTDDFLWLDSDLIIRPGWCELFDLGAAALADDSKIAVAVRDRQQMIDILRARGNNAAFTAAGDQYFNSGILYVRPSRWQATDYPTQWPQLVRDEASYGFTIVDQDVLNYLLAGQMAFFPGEFNRIISDPMMGNEKVWHYAGAPKPWRIEGDMRGFYMAVETINLDRPAHRITDGGSAYSMYPRYWEAEAEVLATIAARDQVLADDLWRRRDGQMLTLSRAQKAKWAIMRLAARQWR
jgi:lipopolysaccharide biosynthesis glycosyltransferase